MHAGQLRLISKTGRKLLLESAHCDLILTFVALRIAKLDQRGRCLLRIAGLLVKRQGLFYQLDRFVGFTLLPTQSPKRQRSSRLAAA